MVKLEECVEITTTQYVELKDPQFIGQTRVNADGDYWMVSEDNNITYKVKHNLYK